MIRVLLADDHKLLIDGLRSLLEAKGAIEIVGVAQDGLEAVSLCEKLKPDIVLLDISMPRLNGIDSARKILAEAPHTKIIILSMHADSRFVRESLRVGASGYILKESAASEVFDAIRQVSNGELFFSKSLRDQVLREYVDWVRDKGNLTDSPLSAREREVLQLLAEGKSTKDVADLLNLSVKTIESHRKQIMDKLDLHSIAELTKYAIREGLTQLE